MQASPVPIGGRAVYIEEKKPMGRGKFTYSPLISDPLGICRHARTMMLTSVEEQLH